MGIFYNINIRYFGKINYLFKKIQINIFYTFWGTEYKKEIKKFIICKNEQKYTRDK